MSTLAYALWFVAPVVQSVTGGRMWIRHLYREYPFFFVYTLGHVVTFPIVLYLYHLGSLQLYRVTYIGFEAVDVLLKAGVICELFLLVFRPYQGIRRLGSLLLRWGSVILVLIAVAAAASTTGSDADKFLAGLFVMQRSVEIVQGGLLFLLFAVSVALGLQWMYEALGIAVGFGIITGVNLVAYTLRVEFGGTTTDVLSLVAIAAYDVAAVIWLAVLWAPKPVFHFDQRIPSWDVEAWNRALLNLLRQ